MASLAGKTALITGGSRGIGAGIAVHFAKKGVSRIAITYSTDTQTAERTLATLRNLGVSKAVAIQADLLDPEFGPKLISGALQGLKAESIDIIVNNAGVNSGTFLQAVAGTTADGFCKVLQANAFAPLSVINAALPYLPESGGRVINISSVSSKLPNADPYITYGASKAALDSMTRSLAANWASTTRATFNSISVGTTRTEAIQTLLKEHGSQVEEKLRSVFTAGDRIGEVEDVAYVVAFLASEEGRWVNGANVAANGGQRELLALQG